MSYSSSYLQKERQKAKGLFVAQLPKPVLSGSAVLEAGERRTVPYWPSVSLGSGGWGITVPDTG